jgi:hypothetical protein
VSSATTICRAGSADLCDPDESCTGNADEACPDDVVEPNTTVCREGPDECDLDELCTGEPGDACPPDEPVLCVQIPAQIAPTKTTCEDFRDGVAEDLVSVYYSLKGNEINQVNPGVLFLYDQIFASGPTTITVTQSNIGADCDWPNLPPQKIGQIILWSNPGCIKVQLTGSYDESTGTVTINNVPEGDYILGIKYDPDFVDGFDECVDDEPTVTYTFETSVDGIQSSTASVDFVPNE